MADRHTPRCGNCGAPTRPQEVRGVQSLVCVSCGAVTAGRGPEPAPLSSHVPRHTPGPNVRRSEMSIRTGPPSSEGLYTSDGLAALSEAAFELELERAHALKRRRLTVGLGLGICALVVVLAVPLSFVVYQAVLTWSQRPPVPPPPVSLRDALPPPPPPTPNPSPTPEVAEAPAPAPAPSPRARARALVSQGWGLVNRDPVAAAARFQDALALDAGSADASYGVGYALLKQGNPSGARPWLCTALRTGDLEVKRDVQSLLDSNSLNCP